MSTLHGHVARAGEPEQLRGDQPGAGEAGTTSGGHVARAGVIDVSHNVILYLEAIRP